MSKKTRRQKEVARLRRDLEIIKTQMRLQSPVESLSVARPVKADDSDNFRLGQNMTPERARKLSESSILSETKTTTGANHSYLKRDLLKTFVLSGLCLTVIAGLYFLQTRTQILSKFIPL